MGGLKWRFQVQKEKGHRAGSPACAGPTERGGTVSMGPDTKS